MSETQARTQSRQYRVLVRDTKTNNVRRLYRAKDGAFTRNADSDRLAAAKPSMFTKAEAREAERWAKGRGLAAYATKSKYPFLVLDGDTSWGNPALSKKLNELGRRRQRYIWIGEYKRTSRRQWELRMLYLQGKGNNAARCCSRYSGQHSWANCGKDSWSNHADGNAADSSYLHSGRGGSYTNLGNDSKCRAIMHDLSLCLPVGGEPWHCERGNTFRA